MIRHLGWATDRLLAFVVPRVPASARPCGCDPGSTWCTSPAVRCQCNGDCVTVYCYCPVNGCR